MTACYTTARAAQIAGVSRPTISAALKSGDLRGTMSNRNRWSISDPDLRDWMGRRVERAAPDPVPAAPPPSSELFVRVAAAEAAAAAADARALIAEGRAAEASAAADRAGERAGAAEARAAVAEAAAALATAQIERIRGRGLWDRILNRT